MITVRIYNSDIMYLYVINAQLQLTVTAKYNNNSNC